MRELSEKERDLLSCLQHRGSSDFRQIARILKTKETVVRNSFHRLKELGLILGRYPFIDSIRLGYSDFAFYFSLTPQKKDRTEDLVNALIKSSSISWIGLLGGSFQYSLSILAENADQAWKELSEISKRHGMIFSQRRLLIRRKFVAFPRKYLANKRFSHPEFGYGYSELDTKIDQLDHLILKQLSKKPDQSLRDISEILQQPLTTLSRRVNRLQQSGVIKGYIYRLDLSSLGFCTFRILLRTRSLSDSLSNKIESFCRNHPHVLRYMEMFGEWDYEIEVEVPNSKFILTITEQIQSEFMGEIEGIDLLQVFEHLKFVGYPFESPIRR